MARYKVWKLSSSGSSLTSWLTSRQVFEKSREDPDIVKLRANRQKTKDKLGPEIGFVMAWPTHPPYNFF